MTYYQFVQAVETKVKEVVRDKIEVCAHTAEKNNGVTRKGIMLTERGINISPTIYLEEYYRQFQNGNSLDHIAADILRLYHEVRFRKSWDAEKMTDYEKVEDRIIYRLVNRGANEKFLENVPHIPYLDLAIVFCVLLEMWGVSGEDLYKKASENTCRLLPDDFSTMSKVIEELSDMPQEDGEEYMYVLSNRIRSYGSAAILYDRRLEGIGMYLKSNYYVLPSSIHEVIIIPEKAAPGKEPLSQMVGEINRTQVAEEEILSDHAYYYDREKKRLIL